MPPFDAAPVARPFLGIASPPEDRPPARARSPRRATPEGGVPALFLVAVALIGGAGASYPLLEVVVELLSAGLIAHTLVGPGPRPVVRGVEWVLLGLMVLVPLAQLIPLPLGVWTTLPGRGLPSAVLRAVGPPPAASPLSLTPAATLRAALALLPGIAFFLAARAQRAGGRLTVTRVVVGLAVLSATLGAAQLAGAAPSFESAHAGQAIGLFVNRNHQAALLLVAVVLLPTALRRGGVPAVGYGIAALLAAGVIATTSRTALLLLPACLAPLLWPVARRSPRAAAATIVAVTAVAGAAWWQGSLPRLLARFGASELRPAIWRTSWAAAQAYFPAGAGMGAFKSVYPLFERRDALTPFLVNHAQ